MKSRVNSRLLVQSMEVEDTKLKILFLGEPSSPNTVSFAEGLREAGCEVVLASVRTDGADGAWPIGPVGMPARLRALLGVGSVKTLISDIKPDLLLAYRITSYGYIAAGTGFHPMVLAAQNEKIVFLREPSWWREKLLGRFARRAIRGADMIHAWGPNIRDGLLSFGADEDKILTLHRGVDFSGLPSADAKKEFDPERPVFLSSRSLYPEYKVDAVVEAFASFSEAVPGARLRIAGDGPEAGKISSLVQNLGLEDKVAILGRVSKEEIVRELAGADIYISVIGTEGVSSSLVEACACGLLPVVVDMPASRLLVEDGKTGILISGASLENIAAAMKKAVGDFESMRPALIGNAKRTRENFDRRRNIQVFVERYKELVRTAGKGR